MTTQNAAEFQVTDVPRVEVRPFLRNVYLWMTVGLLATAMSSYITVTTPALRSLALNSFVVFGAFIVQLILVGKLAAAIHRLSSGQATALFIGYASLTGFTLSLILVVFDLGTLTMAFATTAVLFLTMTAFAVLTSIDLTKYGTYFLIGLIGLVLAMVINIFIGSSTFDLIFSALGVILFSALTAYDTQRLQKLASDPRIGGEGSELMRKLSIQGALSLYLDFLNLFLFLLRIFGRNR